jgi:hypothetical protein
MNIWIVEDGETDTQLAAETVLAAAESVSSSRRVSTDLYWEKTLRWDAEPRLYHIPVGDDAKPRLGAASAIDRLTVSLAPRIVVLDLLASHVFEGQTFLYSLRAWEARHSLPSCYVIIWSAYTGKREVSEFLRLEPERDRRVARAIKNPASLNRALQGFLHTMVELEHL